jgi:hypothetical protein
VHREQAGPASARRLASAFRIHRITNGIEASLALPAVAVVDLFVGSIEPTRVTVLAITVITWGMVVAHLASILSSSRLRRPSASLSCPDGHSP